MNEQQYSYAASVKSNASDELVNTYLIRPLAGVIVRFLFHTPLTPNHVTILSIVAGCVAAYFYQGGTAMQNVVAGACVTLKDVLDSADGQLARAKQQYSRKGRFLDSLGDFFVNVLVLGAITFALVHATHSLTVIVLGVCALLGITLRVSYHVFYQTSFLHLLDAYKMNRVTEEIQPEDIRGDKLTLQLQHTFQYIYGWQDRLMLRIDGWCRNGLEHNQKVDQAWYGDRIALRISGLMGLGTELLVLTAFSVFDKPEFYLYVNVTALNLLWAVAILYRRCVLKKKLTDDWSRSR